MNEQSLRILAEYLGPSIKKFVRPTIEEFAKTHFYVSDTQRPIVLMPHQASIINYALDNAFTTIIYSTIKKSGKTTIAALVAKYVAATYGPFQEIIIVANDFEQARGRIYQKVEESIFLEKDPTWKVTQRGITHLPSRSVIRAISGDYAGEAGANPTASFYSELWGFREERLNRLWDELTPVPTRKNSFRFVETYVGFEDESLLLLDLWKQGLKGRRLTHDEIFWPFPDQPPIWVNEKASLFMYYDCGVEARRMPWQTPEYYIEQELLLRPEAYQRLHQNLWVSSLSEFIPIVQWDKCQDLVHIEKDTPVVIAADASVSGDSTSLTMVSRHPIYKDHVIEIETRIWKPPRGGSIDLDETVYNTIVEWCSNYNVIEVAYDAYQLHSIMTRLTKEGVCWCKPFSQGTKRNEADKQLYDLIMHKRLHHSGNPELREHIKNCAIKVAANEDTKLRLVKKSKNYKIDGAVALSMAAFECLRLLLD